MTPVSFTQTDATGCTSSHPWSAKSPAIITRNLTRLDMPQGLETVRVTVTNADGTRSTYRRKR